MTNTESTITTEILPGGETFKYQNKLPKLPIPNLKDTTDRYLSALQPLQVSIVKISLFFKREIDL